MLPMKDVELSAIESKAMDAIVASAIVIHTIIENITDSYTNITLIV